MSGFSCCTHLVGSSLMCAALHFSAALGFAITVHNSGWLLNWSLCLNMPWVLLWPLRADEPAELHVRKPSGKWFWGEESCFSFTPQPPGHMQVCDYIVTTQAGVQWKYRIRELSRQYCRPGNPTEDHPDEPYNLSATALPYHPGE